MHLSWFGGVQYIIGFSIEIYHKQKNIFYCEIYWHTVMCYHCMFYGEILATTAASEIYSS